MKNSTPKQFELQPNSRRDLLEQSKLSRLPERAPFRLPDFDNTPTVAVVAVCAGCNARLDTDDTLQIKFSGCRKCVSIYGRLDAAREENAKRETRELLERFAGGVK
jgi:ribosomal protein L40E